MEATQHVRGKEGLVPAWLCESTRSTSPSLSYWTCMAPRQPEHPRVTSHPDNPENASDGETARRGHGISPCSMPWNPGRLAWGPEPRDVVGQAPGPALFPGAELPPDFPA